MTDQATGLKAYFGVETARLLGSTIQSVYPPFDVAAYAARVADQVDGKELKARVTVMAAELAKQLPAAYPDALAVLVSSLGEELAEGEGMFDKSWYLMPVARFVEEYGLDHPDESLPALAEITKRHTAEYAIRPFMEAHPELTLRRLGEWAKDPSHNVRRLVSEGSRPRLPWARQLPRFVEDPSPVLRLLEPLRSDPSAYVRKSVANNLNDIAKDHPAVTLATVERWLAESPTPETTWISKRAVRTLVKQGDALALALLGMTGGAHMRVSALEVTPHDVALGGRVVLSFELTNTDSQPHKVTIDYVVHHIRKNGTTGPKVFKLATADMAAGEQRSFEKVHPVREVSTRRYYPGRHRVDLQVNGSTAASGAFNLRR